MVSASHGNIHFVISLGIQWTVFVFLTKPSELQNCTSFQNYTTLSSPLSSPIFNIFSTVIIKFLTTLRVGFSLPREHTFCHIFGNSMNRICIFNKAVGTTKLHFIPKLHYTFFPTIKVLHMKYRRFCKILKKLTPIFTA